MDTQHKVLIVLVVLVAINTAIGIATLAHEQNARKNFVQACKDLCKLNWTKFTDSTSMIFDLLFLSVLGIVTWLLLYLSANRMSNKPH